MSPSIVADLHSHTTASDGALAIEEIPSAAKKAGINWVAVTDHDRIHAELDNPITTIEGISIIRGIELRVQTETQRIDLLGYAVERTEELIGEIERLQKDRISRAKRIINCLKREEDVFLGLEPESGIGRPHIATAIDESDAPYDDTKAFEELIGNDCDCYFARDITDIDEGIRLLKDACSVVGLAHPLRYDDPEAALQVTDRLDAVERYYPYETEVNTSIVDRAIERNDLLVTGGSDAHNKRFGQAGLSESQFEEFKVTFQE